MWVWHAFIGIFPWNYNFWANNRKRNDQAKFYWNNYDSYRCYCCCNFFFFVISPNVCHLNVQFKPEKKFRKPTLIYRTRALLHFLYWFEMKKKKKIKAHEVFFSLYNSLTLYMYTTYIQSNASWSTNQWLLLVSNDRFNTVVVLLRHVIICVLTHSILIWNPP